MDTAQEDEILERFDAGTEKRSTRTFKFSLRFIGTFNRQEEEELLVEEGRMWAQVDLPGLLPEDASIMIGENDDAYICIYHEESFDVYFIDTVTVSLWERIKQVIGGIFNDRKAERSS